MTGALLHDIGKLDAYEIQGDAIEMSDSGRLFGEIPLGYYRIRRAIEGIDGFPPGHAQARCCTSSSATTARWSTAAP